MNIRLKIIMPMMMLSTSCIFSSSSNSFSTRQPKTNNQLEVPEIRDVCIKSAKENLELNKKRVQNFIAQYEKENISLVPLKEYHQAYANVIKFSHLGLRAQKNIDNRKQQHAPAQEINILLHHLSFLKKCEIKAMDSYNTKLNQAAMDNNTWPLLFCLIERQRNLHFSQATLFAAEKKELQIHNAQQAKQIELLECSLNHVLSKDRQV